MYLPGSVYFKKVRDIVTLTFLNINGELPAPGVRDTGFRRFDIGFILDDCVDNNGVSRFSGSIFVQSTTDLKYHMHSNSLYFQVTTPVVEQ